MKTNIQTKSNGQAPIGRHVEKRRAPGLALITSNGSKGPFSPPANDDRQSSGIPSFAVVLWIERLDRSNPHHIRISLKAPSSLDPTGESKAFTIDGTLHDGASVKIADLVQLTRPKRGAEFGPDDICAIGEGEPIAVRATINSILYRGKPGSGFIIAGLGVAGFSSAKGDFDNGGRAVETGDIGVFTGTPFAYQRNDRAPARQSLHVRSAQFVERTLSNHWRLAARREGVILSDALLERLESELGADWPLVLARDPNRLNDATFARFQEKTRKSLLDSVYALCGAHLAERDMLAAGMTQASIRAACERIAKPPFNRSRRGFDARLLIPGGYVTPLHVHDLHKSGVFFKPCADIDDAMAAVWHELALGAGRERSGGVKDRFENIRAQGSTAFPLDILDRVLWRRCKLDPQSIRDTCANLPVTETIGSSIALARAVKVERELLSMVRARTEPQVHVHG